MSALAPHVAASLEAHGLLPPDGGLLVAVSGGADSMVLLHLLHRLGPFRPEGTLQLTVAHANHQLRGAESDADEALVAATARALGRPYVVERLDIHNARSRTRESVEMTARRLRHAFLARVAHEHGIRFVALAHHAGDQAELVLLRLMRGAGGEGLGGMPWSNPSPAEPRVTLIRPLLDCAKAGLLEFARANGIGFRDDASNRDRDIPRNRVRHELLPLLAREFNPAIETALARVADITGTEADFVAAEAGRWLAAGRRKAFERLHPAVQRAVVRQQLWSLGHDAGFSLVESLRLRATPISLPGGEVFQRESTGSIIQPIRTAAAAFMPAEQAVKLERAGGRLEFAGVRLRYRFSSPAAVPARTRRGSEVFAAAAVGSRVILRHWQRGDRFQPLGFPRPTKLQDLFVNRKVPAARRRQLLVATTVSGELFWVESLPPGERFKLRPTTRRTLGWSWIRPGDLLGETSLAPK